MKMTILPQKETTSEKSKTEKMLSAMDLYVKKAVEIELKRQLEQHYTPLFEETIKILEKNTALLEELTTKVALKIASIEKQVQEIYNYVFKGQKPPSYTA